MGALLCKSAFANDEQKKIEKKVFGHFFDVASMELGLTEWIQCDKPDFLCNSTTGRIIGIEVFDYIRGKFGKHGSTERRNESTAFQIEKEITAKIQSKYPNPFYCAATFQPNIFEIITSRKSSIKSISEELFEKICGVVDEMNGDSTYLWYSDLFENGLIEYIKDLKIDRTSKWNGYHFFSHQIGGAINFDQAAFQNRAKEKEKKISEYLKNCDECWILGMAYGSYISSSINLKSEILIKFETKFTKAIIYATPKDYKVF